MTDFLKRFDGTGRTPRQVQIEALRWLEKHWHESSVFALSMPVGTGKSAVARAIQQAAGAHIIVPQNVLIDQYTDIYPKVNYLKGRSHYQCSWGCSCEDWVGVLQEKACGNCPYTAARTAAADGEPTFFNPMSLFYLRDREPSDVLVVDEAHSLLPMIALLCGVRLKQSVYGFTKKEINEVGLVEWLTIQVARLKKMADQYTKVQDFKRVTEITSELERLRLTRSCLVDDAQNYAVWYEEGRSRGKKESFLNIKPIQPPPFMVKKILDCKKLVLMSGTLMPPDLRALLHERAYRYLDLPSPIAVERRQIRYEPVSYKLNYQTNPMQLAASIAGVIEKYPGLNTIIHVSYELSERLQKVLAFPVIANGREDKIEKIEQFKREGGIFLAAGCSEGLDLKDDTCRLNIIPKLVFPHLGDQVVQKRKSLPDGDEWFAMETLKTTIQQAGRSTRGESDYSKVIVMDPNFGRLVRQYKTRLPKYFVEAIVWTT